MNQYEKRVKKNKLYKEFVDILNGKLQLSHRELELLTFLVKAETEWQPRIEGEEKNILSTDSRRLVMKETMINKSNLSKYLNVLREKGILTHDGKKFELNPILIPNIDKNKITVVFDIIIEE